MIFIQVHEEGRLEHRINPAQIIRMFPHGNHGQTRIVLTEGRGGTDTFQPKDLTVVETLDQITSQLQASS